jgi:hypothetical protein
MAEMSAEGQGSPTEDVEVGSQTGEDQSGGNENNPAWSELLGVVPPELHNQVTPHLQKWDQNFDKVQSQYAPYKQFVENNVAPDNISYALNVMQEIESNPMGIIEALTNYAKENSLWKDPVAAPEEGEEGQGQVDSELPDITQHPEFIKVKQLAETLGQQFLSQQQAQQQAQEDEELEGQISTLEEEFGEFDKDWVLQKAVAAVEAGQNVEDLRPFVEQYRQFEQSIIEKSKKPAPRILPSGGQAVSNNGVDPSKMTPNERRQYIVDTLKANSQQQ